MDKIPNDITTEDFQEILQKIDESLDRSIIKADEILEAQERINRNKKIQRALRYKKNED